MGSRAILYARVSCASQEREGHSLPAQIATLRAFAERNRLQVVEEIVETGSSSRFAKRRRPGFDRLMARIRAGEVDALVVVAIDRATRTPRDAEELLDLMETGVRLHTVQLGRSFSSDATPEDRWLLRVESANAELEVARLSRRVRAGQQARLAAGLPLGPVPPGLVHVRRDGRRVVELDPDQAARVRTLAEEYAAGRHSIDTLTVRAAELGLRSRLGSPLTRTAVANLLGNPMLAGRLRSGDLGSFPRVLGDDLWYAVQGMRERLRSCPAGAGRRAFAFGQLLRCGSCGSAIVGARARGRSRHYLYYRCAGWRRACPDASLHVPEGEVMEQVQALLTPMRIPEELAQYLRDEALCLLHEEGDARLREREDIHRRDVELEARILRATEARIAGEIDTAATAELVARWRAEQSGMRARQARLGETTDSLGEVLDGLIRLARGAAEVLPSLAERDPRAARELVRYYLADGPTMARGRLQAALRPEFAAWCGTVAGAAPGAAGEALAAPGRLRILDGRVEPLGLAPVAAPERDRQGAVQDLGDTGRGGNRGAMALLGAPRPAEWWYREVLDLLAA